MSKIIRKIITTNNAPQSTFPLKFVKISKSFFIKRIYHFITFSQAIVVDRTVYVSGCVGMDKDTMKLVEGGVVPETIQVLKNLVAVLEASGSSAEKVIKTTIFVENMGDFALVNEEYKKGNKFPIYHFLKRVNSILLSLLQ